MRMPRPSPLRIEHLGLQDGAASVAIHGELDLETAPELRSVLCLLGQVYGGVIADLGDVGFCDVAGLHALVDADDHLRSIHSSLTLRRATPKFHWLVQLTGLAPWLHFADSARGRWADPANEPGGDLGGGCRSVVNGALVPAVGSR